jgi:hypothetical protein
VGVSRFFVRSLSCLLKINDGRRCRFDICLLLRATAFIATSEHINDDQAQQQIIKIKQNKTNKNKQTTTHLQRQAAHAKKTGKTVILRRLNDNHSWREGDDQQHLASSDLEMRNDLACAACENEERRRHH